MRIVIDTDPWEALHRATKERTCAELKRRYQGKELTPEVEDDVRKELPAIVNDAVTEALASADFLVVVHSEEEEATHDK